MIGGVAGGLAEYFSIDVTIVRIVFVILLIVLPGVGFIAYIAAWMLIPENPMKDPIPKPIAHKPELDNGLDNNKEKTKPVSHEIETPPPTASIQNSNDSNRRIFGFLLVGLGAFFLLRDFIDFSLIGKLWPLALILVGVVILASRGKRS